MKATMISQWRSVRLWPMEGHRLLGCIVLNRLRVRLALVIALHGLVGCPAQELEADKRARLEQSADAITIEESTASAETPASGQSQAWESIQRIVINGSGHSSETAPYKDYSAQPFARVRLDELLEIRLGPHYSSEHQWTETWRVWIDMNGDRRFSEDELVLNTVGVGEVESKLSWTESQANQLFGDKPRTRIMRVAMAWQASPGPNDRFRYGQVNDYSLIFDRRHDRARPIRLLSGTIRPWENRPALHVEPGLHHLIQFRDIPSRKEKQVLEAMGVLLLDFVPEGSFWARIDSSQEALADLTVAGGVVFAMPGEARLKVSPKVAAGGFASSIRKAAGGVEFFVKWFVDTSERERTSALAAIGDIELLHERSPTTSVIAVLPTRVLELAESDAVQWIEPVPAPAEVDSLNGNSNHSVTPLFAPPYDLDGSGIKAAVFDGCFADADHVEFGGRLSYDINLGNVQWCDTTGGYVRSHPTHSAGIVGASGIGDSSAIGAAPAATLLSYAFHNYYSSAEFENQIISEEISVSSHSYSSPTVSESDYGEYFAWARDADRWSHDYELLSVWSAGNYGLYRSAFDVLDWHNLNWNTMHNGGIGKNSIAVGAGEKTNFAGYSYQLRLDSSKGPTQDGRVKPDFVAMGMGTIQTPEAGGGYGTSNSTSAAAPQVAGIIALMAQEYKNRHGNSAMLPPTLAKVLLIQSAEDMTEDDTFYWCSNGSGNEWCDGIELTHSNPGPDYATGWGWVNAKTAIDLLQDTGRYLKGTIAVGEERRYRITLPATSTFKSTLLWSDPPATEGAAPALVNNLDLELHAAGSPVAYPYVLDPNNPDQPATAGINTLDNVVQIKIDDLDPGTYELVVKGTTVPVGPQDFHLVASNAFHPIILYATTSTFDGNLGGRPGADEKCRIEKVPVCADRDNARALITIHTGDEVRDMQALYDIPDTVVEGSAGLKLASRWSELIGVPLPHTMRDATNLTQVYWWSGSHWDGSTYPYVTPGSSYYCSQFTSSTSNFRAPYGSGTITSVGAQYELGWLGGNQYPHCSRNLPLMCVCY